MFMSGCESVGTVYRNGPQRNIARIEGKIFDSMEEAEAHATAAGQGVGG